MKKIILGLMSLVSVSAYSHVVLETQTAEMGAYYKAVLKVSHGCEGSAIKKIVVQVPDGFQGAKPMVKPGWNIAIRKEKLAVPYTSHGKKIDQDTREIVWDGGLLPNAYYDEFVVVGKLPEKAGKIYWKVKQICEKGEIDWSQIPVGSQSLRDLEYPAAVLNLTKPQTEEHHHKH
jgi:uncharacterized protein YcnI